MKYEILYGYLYVFRSLLFHNQYKVICIWIYYIYIYYYKKLTLYLFISIQLIEEEKKSSVSLCSSEKSNQMMMWNFMWKWVNVVLFLYMLFEIETQHNWKKEQERASTPTLPILPTPVHKQQIPTASILTQQCTSIYNAALLKPKTKTTQQS